MARDRVWGLAMPAAVFAGLCAGFVAYVVTSSAALPARVATHFDGRGRADGWMSRTAHVFWMSAAGVGVPLIVVGTCFAARFVSNDMVNVPNKDYWLAGERRAGTVDYLLRQAIWLGCWVVGLFVAVQYWVVEANVRTPARLGEGVGWVLGAFVAGVMGWVVALVWHFARAPAEGTAT